jgi:hypothetical protein
VDNNLITKVLKKIYKEEQINGAKLNKKKMTIHYDESHMLGDLNGDYLKKKLINYIGEDLSNYILQKKLHLESAGFEDGNAKINIQVNGLNNIKDFIDVSLGIKKQAIINSFSGVKTRFGIDDKINSYRYNTGIFEMPDVKPVAKGFVYFKEDNIDNGLSFPAELYISPLTPFLDDNLKKYRITGEFFEIICYPYLGRIQISSSLEGVRLKVPKLIDAFKLLIRFSTPNFKHILDFCFKDYPEQRFEFVGTDLDFRYEDEFFTLKSAQELIRLFEISDDIHISYNDLVQNGYKINGTNKIISHFEEQVRVEFTGELDQSDMEKEAASVFLFKTNIGNFMIGAIMVFFGDIEKIDTQRFRLNSIRSRIERKIVVRPGDSIGEYEVLPIIEAIEDKYSKDYTVITTIKKKTNNKLGNQ